MKSRSSDSISASMRRRKKAARVPAERVGRPGRQKTHRRSVEIIEAAAQVFAERGYHGASTQDIADILHIRQASLYYYVPSKEAALELVCIQGVAGFFETGQAIASGPGNARERLAGLIRAHVAPIVDRGDFVRVFLTQRQFLPTRSRRRVGKWSRGLEKVFEGVIRDGIRKAEFRDDLDPRITTLAILGMANGVSAWYDKENLSTERIAGEFIHFVLNGIGQARSRGGLARSRR